MGDKIAAKELAVRAGLPVIPGHADALDTVNEALTVAGSIGYTVPVGRDDAGIRTLLKDYARKFILSSGYHSLATVEFLLDADGTPYLIECCCLRSLLYRVLPEVGY